MAVGGSDIAPYWATGSHFTRKGQADMHMAKASETDIQSVRMFFQSLEALFERGRRSPHSDELADAVRNQWESTPGVSGSWSRVVEGLVVLLHNCCDPDLDYLEWKPGIYALLKKQGTTERLVACGQAAIEALGLECENDSPADVREAIKMLT